MCIRDRSIDTAYERAKEILNANPDLAGFTGVASTDCPGIAQAVEELGLNVKVVGVGTPNEFRPYGESGTISTIKLWDPKDAGYAMCQTAAMILRGEEVGEGANLVAPGYESVTLVEGDNRCLVGDADIKMCIRDRLIASQRRQHGRYLQIRYEETVEGSACRADYQRNQDCHCIISAALQIEAGQNAAQVCNIYGRQVDSA